MVGGAERPGIVLCMTDDQGWGDVGYAGLRKVATPELDRMAADGLRFERFYAQQSCSPSRASAMTGRHPNRMGVFWPGMPIRTGEEILAQMLGRIGYATGHFGKWHLNGVAGPGKVMREDDARSPRRLGFAESFSVSNYFETDWTFGRNGVAERVEGDGSEVVVREALRFVERERGRPFLAVVWFGSPHVPHQPLREDLAAAGGSGFYGELLAVDRAMGQLRRGLRELGVAERTMVWFSSDNGGWQDPKAPEAHGTNGGLRGRKGDMWEGGIRVPGIVEWPGRIRPGVTDVPAGLVDIVPTVLEVTGVVPVRVVPMDGTSLLPLFEGRMRERVRPLGFWQYVGNGRGMDADSGPAAWSGQRFKLVKPGRGRWELYDLVSDRRETLDVASRYPEVVEKMKRELGAWQRSVVDSYEGADGIAP
jgi:arylsulfatase A-like enzyme